MQAETWDIMMQKFSRIATAAQGCAGVCVK